MKEYSQVMESCKEINNIMDDIASLLEENSIDFTRNASANEIIVSNETKKNINNLIRTLSIPKIVLQIILDVCEIKNNVYIRKKIK